MSRTPQLTPKAGLVLAGLLVLAALGWAFWMLVGSAYGPTERKAVIRREIALRVMADYLRAQFSGQRALIVSNPFTRRPGQPREVYAFEEAGVRGLKKGWADKLQLLGVAFPELNPAALQNPASIPMDAQTTTPLSFLTSDDAWDKLLQRYPATDLVVSLIGLPANLTRLELWRQARPRLALLLPDLRMVGDAAAVKTAFASGKVVAMILDKPGAPPEATPLARDYRVEFDQRFILVTSENAAQVVDFLPRWY